MSEIIKKQLERVIKSAPINRTAQNVISRGEHWEPSNKVDQRTWDNPPNLPIRSADVKDLSGKTFGRMTVIGWMSRQPKKGSTWLVRCVCGLYLTRKSHAINNPNNSDDCCDRCRHLIHLQRLRHKNNTGQWPEVTA